MTGGAGVAEEADWDAYAHDPALLLTAAMRLGGNGQDRRVGLDRLTVAGTEFVVSTVDLVVPHPGGHWETRVQSPKDGWNVRRYRSQEEAAAGHARIVAAVQAGVPVAELE